MAGPAVAPYGAWRSPIRDDLARDVIGLAEPWVDGDDVYWLEGRPTVGCRRVLVRAALDGSTADVTPPPINVRTRVHEYGGGSYTVADGVVVFSDFQCPFCGRFAPVFDRLHEEFGDDNLRIVFKHQPLPVHPHAGPAARS